jgi:hypothetical protein
MYGYYGYYFYAGYDRNNCLASEYVWRGKNFIVANHDYWTDFNEIYYDLTL